MGVKLFEHQDFINVWSQTRPMSNFHPLDVVDVVEVNLSPTEVVSRYRDPQLQEGEKVYCTT